MLTYYPLDETFRVRPPKTIEADFARMIEVAAGKPVHLLEAGYPSASACGSSPQQQAAFIDAMFAAWDKHVDAVPLINFVWTCDLSERASLLASLNDCQTTLTWRISSLD